MSVTTTEKNNILIIELSQPKKLNALSKSVFLELKNLLVNLNSEIKGLIITGSGEKAFAAGADILEMSKMSPKEGKDYAQLAQEVTLLIEECAIPVIACVNGYALGGGCELAMACDFIYASKNAAFGQPEVSLGLIPGFGGCVRLQKKIGINKAKEMIFTGDIIDAQQALEIGIVNKIYNSKDELIDGALTCFDKMSKKSLEAIKICKETINNCENIDTKKALSIELNAFEKSFSHDDKKEGVNAFLKKRTANF